LPIDSLPERAMKWLGLFENNLVGMNDKLINITAELMIEKMLIRDNERDMVIMMHFFRVKYNNGKSEIIRSTMLDYGSFITNTAIARTVSLPAAVAVTLILDNKINLKGVQIPVEPEIYKPVLEKLEDLDIQIYEEYGLANNMSIF